MAPVDTFLEYLRGEQITIRVGTGDESKGYQLPKGLLCSRSTWFSNALKDERFQEAQTGVMHLPDDPTRAFDHFVLFLYKHALEFDQICPLDNEAFAEACAAQLLECFQTWTFGDKYNLPDLQNCVMHRACNIFLKARSTKREIDSGALQECWQAVPDGASIRLLITDYIVDSMASDVSSSGRFEHLGTSPGFLQELHNSEECMHSNKRDFPRFVKPAKHAGTLYVEGGHKAGKKKGQVVVANYSWKITSCAAQCYECGYLEDVEPVCAGCRVFLRSCRCAMSRGAISPEHLLLCSDCIGERSEHRMEDEADDM